MEEQFTLTFKDVRIITLNRRTNHFPVKKKESSQQKNVYPTFSLYIRKSSLWASSGPPSSASFHRYVRPPQHTSKQSKECKLGKHVFLFGKGGSSMDIIPLMKTGLSLLCFAYTFCSDSGRSTRVPLSAGMSNCIYWLWNLRNSCKD